MSILMHQKGPTWEKVYSHQLKVPIVQKINWLYSWIFLFDDLLKLVFLFLYGTEQRLQSDVLCCFAKWNKVTVSGYFLVYYKPQLGLVFIIDEANLLLAPATFCPVDYHSGSIVYSAGSVLHVNKQIVINIQVNTPPPPPTPHPQCPQMPYPPKNIACISSIKTYIWAADKCQLLHMVG